MDKDQKFYTTGDASCTSGGVVPIVFSKTCLSCAEGEAPIDIESITWTPSTYTLTFYLTDKTKRTLDIPHTHALSELSDVDVSGVSTGQVLQKSAGDWVPLTLATVATTGSYNDLSNKPTYALNDLTDVSVAGATTGQVLYKSSGDWAPLTIATVATTGSYNDLTNKPFAGSPTDQAVVYYNSGTGLYTTIGRPSTYEGKMLTYNVSGDLEWVDISFLAAGPTNAVQYKGPSGVLAGSANFTFNGTNAELTGGYFQVGNIRSESNTIQSVSGQLTLSGASNVRVANLASAAVSIVTASTSGVLGVTDFSTLVNGTVDYIPKFITSTSIGDSEAYYSGSGLFFAHSGTTTFTALAGSGIRLLSVDSNGTLMNDGAGTAGTLPLWEGTDNLANSKISQVSSDVLVSLTGGGGFRVGNTTSENTYIQAAVDYGGGSQSDLTMSLSTTGGALQYNNSGTGYGQMYMTTTEIGFYEGAATGGNRIMQMDLSANTVIISRRLYLSTVDSANDTSILTLSGSNEVQQRSFLSFAQGGDVILNGGNSGGSYIGTYIRIVDIGAWNMDTTDLKSVPHGLNLSNDRIIALILGIRSDSGGNSFPGMMCLASGALPESSTDVGFYADNVFDSTNIYLSRKTGGFYDSSDYDGSVNRGQITIIYEVNGHP